MQKLDKTFNSILSTKYRAWIDKLNTAGKKHDRNNRYYYDDIAMNLYKCQIGVCAYTEMFICIPELYADINWKNGRYKITNNKEYDRLDHLGEMDHFDANDKAKHYWQWDNLFMIHAKVNSIKSNKVSGKFLKPDNPEYSPEKYFDYDEITHRFIPNTNIVDLNLVHEIQYMIDHVLLLNHGVVRNERRDWINMIKDKKEKGLKFTIDRFFTATKWCLAGN